MLRIQLLKIGSAVQRLRCELDIMNKVSAHRGVARGPPRLLQERQACSEDRRGLCAFLGGGPLCPLRVDAEAGRQWLEVHSDSLAGVRWPVPSHRRVRGFPH